MNISDGYHSSGADKRVARMTIGSTFSLGFRRAPEFAVLMLEMVVCIL